MPSVPACSLDESASCRGNLERLPDKFKSRSISQIILRDCDFLNWSMGRVFSRFPSLERLSVAFTETRARHQEAELIAHWIGEFGHQARQLKYLRLQGFRFFGPRDSGRYLAAHHQGPIASRIGLTEFPAVQELVVDISTVEPSSNKRHPGQFIDFFPATVQEITLKAPKRSSWGLNSLVAGKTLLPQWTKLKLVCLLHQTEAKADYEGLKTELHAVGVSFEASFERVN